MSEYISRDEVINAIKNLESSMPAKDNYAKGYDAALGRVLIAVREVPPATDVQPVKHGRWNEIYHDNENYSASCTYCQEPTVRRVWFRPYDFCPHCGARMDGDEE